MAAGDVRESFYLTRQVLPEPRPILGDPNAALRSAVSNIREALGSPMSKPLTWLTARYAQRIIV